MSRIVLGFVWLILAVLMFLVDEETAGWASIIISNVWLASTQVGRAA